MTLGTNIQNLRKANGWTVLQLAEKSGIAYPTLLNTEKDKSKPHAGTLAKLATLFGVDSLEGDVAIPGVTPASAPSTDVGDTIKRLRDAKGMTQKALAEAADVALPTISNLENGKGSPRASTLAKIQQVLGITSFDSVTITTPDNDAPAETPVVEETPAVTGASFGENVRLARKKLGWSQKELADKAEVSMPTIGNIEKGNGSPRGKTLNAILGALGLTLEDLQTSPQATEDSITVGVMSPEDAAATPDAPITVSVMAPEATPANIGVKAPIVAPAPNDTALYIDLSAEQVAALKKLGKTGLYLGKNPEDVAKEILCNALRTLLA